MPLVDCPQFSLMEDLDMKKIVLVLLVVVFSIGLLTAQTVAVRGASPIWETRPASSSTVEQAGWFPLEGQIMAWVFDKSGKQAAFGIASAVDGSYEMVFPCSFDFSDNLAPFSVQVVHSNVSLFPAPRMIHGVTRHQLPLTVDFRFRPSTDSFE